MKYIFPKAAAAVLMAAAVISCDDRFERDLGGSSDNTVHKDRMNADSRRRALIMYELGYNTLSSYLSDDIQEICESNLPLENGNLLFIYSHLCSSGNYSQDESPVLERVYQGYDGKTVRDTLKVYDSSTNTASASEIKNVITYITDTYSAGSWGMILSSHGTGWLPTGYYTNSGYYDHLSFNGIQYRQISTAPLLYIEPENDGPATRSWAQKLYNPLRNYGYEVDLKDLADAIPIHLDYILFDSCLMGGIEVAYELRNVCDRLGFSQTEILADGFDYTKIADFLLNGEEADPLSACRDFYERYQAQSGELQSATISLVDCTRLEPLAKLCKQIFEAHRSAIPNIDPSTVQRYYRYNYHWFYDLKDIVSKMGATDEELEDLDAALDNCMIYRGSTEVFMNAFRINVFSGFSSYLPSNGSSYLDKYYKTLAWNEATEFVK